MTTPCLIVLVTQYLSNSVRDTFQSRIRFFLDFAGVNILYLYLYLYLYLFLYLCYMNDPRSFFLIVKVNFAGVHIGKLIVSLLGKNIKL